MNLDIFNIRYWKMMSETANQRGGSCHLPPKWCIWLPGRTSTRVIYHASFCTTVDAFHGNVCSCTVSSFSRSRSLTRFRIPAVSRSRVASVRHFVLFAPVIGNWPAMKTPGKLPALKLKTGALVEIRFAGPRHYTQCFENWRLRKTFPHYLTNSKLEQKAGSRERGSLLTGFGVVAASLSLGTPLSRPVFIVPYLELNSPYVWHCNRFVLLVRALLSFSFVILALLTVLSRCTTSCY